MIKMNFGKYIVELRKAAGMTQEELANKLGVNYRTVASWEKDRTEPNVMMVEMMAAIFGCTKTRIIYGKDMSPAQMAESDALLLKKIKRLSPRDRAIIEQTIDTMLGEG